MGPKQFLEAYPLNITGQYQGLLKQSLSAVKVGPYVLRIALIFNSSVKISILVTRKSERPLKTG